MMTKYIAVLDFFEASSAGASAEEQVPALRPEGPSRQPEGPSRQQEQVPALRPQSEQEHWLLAWAEEASVRSQTPSGLRRSPEPR